MDNWAFHLTRMLLEFGVRQRSRLLLFLAYTLIFSCFVHAAEVDRLIVAVNGRVITQGDLDLARAVNTIILSDNTASPKSRDEAVDRLVDFELMRQELQNFAMTQEDEGRVQSRLRSLRDTYAEKGGLPLLLKQLGLQESELVAYLRFESSILRFVDFRFRPFAGVSEEEIKTYYESRLKPQLQKATLALPPLQQVSTRIEEILKEEKINAVLDQWIKDIRRAARIEYFIGDPDL